MIDQDDIKTIYQLAEEPLPSGQVSGQDVALTISQALGLISLRVCIIKDAISHGAREKPLASLKELSISLAILGGCLFHIVSDFEDDRETCCN